MTKPPFTGILQADSPHLKSLVSRHFNAGALQACEVAYRLSWELGGCVETIPRLPGVSFNPRPCRIASLLILEGNIRDIETIVIGILSCAPAEPLKQRARRRECSVEQRYIEHAARVSARELPIIPSLEPVYLACDLDILRHLHMSDEPSEARTSHACMIKDRFCGLEKSRLHVMIESAALRLTKTL